MDRKEEFLKKIDEIIKKRENNMSEINKIMDNTLTSIMEDIINDKN